MPSFQWSAVDAGGNVIRGLMEASDRAVVVEWLQRQGRIVLQAEAADRRGVFGRLLHFEVGARRGLDKTSLAAVTGELAIMLGAGQDLDRALRFVIETARNARCRAVLGNIRDKVRGGSSLAAALAAEPRSFPRLYVGLIRVGEASGTLVATLRRLASLIERERSVGSSIRSALVYPILLVIAAIGSIALLLGYVLPQFTPIFEQAGAELPVSTRLLIGIGGAIATIGPWLLALALAGALVGRRMLQKPSVRLAADRLLLRIPIVGRVLRESLAAKFTRTLGTLLQTGVPLIPALGIVKDALNNQAACAIVEAGAAAAKAGAGLSRPLQESGLFPPRMIHLLALGEETAQLPEMALKAAEIHEEQVRLLVERLVALMVPAITIVMGLVVGGTVVSLVSAMLSLNDLVM